MADLLMLYCVAYKGDQKWFYGGVKTVVERSFTIYRKSSVSLSKATRVGKAVADAFVTLMDQPYFSDVCAVRESQVRKC